jgi:ABC-type multidrug transport system ATPase subunit
MEEIEAFCQLIGNMVSGRLKCIGTAQHLRDKFGKGYQLDVKAKLSVA